ncbi:MAG: hypothetical protein IPL38_13710 [Rhodobacter sp.]|nr:hypothetical protein [Rhodobacter sp.]
MKRRALATGMLAAGAAALGATGWRWRARVAERAAFAAHYTTPVATPDGPVAVYHLGHSLVGRDMPAMLAELGGHRWNSQLGWGASLKDHWLGAVPGFAEENASAAFRPAGEALDSGGYPVVVLTEMVELRDAIRWHDSADHLALWALRARAANPAVRVCLYETWHRLDDPAGWQSRTEADLVSLWEDEVLRPAVATAGVIHVIPGGQVMVAVAAEAEAGRIPGLSGRAGLFADAIHFNDIGAWLMAMTHFAAIYARSPLGLPAALRRADGSAATAPLPAAALAMQAVVWRVVRGYALTGVAAAE